MMRTAIAAAIVSACCAMIAFAPEPSAVPTAREARDAGRGITTYARVQHPYASSKEEVVEASETVIVVGR